MKRTIVSCAVLALFCFVSVQQASAFGWRRAHHRACYCQPIVVVAPQAEVAVVEVDESTALSQVIGAVNGILARENDRLERQIEWYEEDQSSASYGSD